MNKALLKQIHREAERIRDKIIKGEKPALRFPLRSLSNVRFDTRSGMLGIGRKTKERTLAMATVKTFAQSLKMIVLA